MPTRRRLLAAVGGAAVAGLAGCSGSESGGSERIDCQSGVLARGEGDLLDGGAMATAEDGDVRLAVPLSADAVREQDVERLVVYDAAGDVTHTIPVSADDAGLMANRSGASEGQLRYQQYLGRRPYHGQYRIVAQNARGDRVDSITIEFNCFPAATADEGNETTE